MGIDKIKLAKLLAISEGIKEKNSADKKGHTNEITPIKALVVFTIFFWLLYIILTR